MPRRRRLLLRFLLWEMRLPVAGRTVPRPLRDAMLRSLHVCELSWPSRVSGQLQSPSSTAEVRRPTPAGEQLLFAIGMAVLRSRRLGMRGMHLTVSGLNCPRLRLSICGSTGA